MEITRTKPKAEITITRNTPQADDFSSLKGTALEHAMRRCYCCKMIFLKGRTISSAQGLHICNHCDGKEDHHVKSNDIIITRTNKIEPENASCNVCQEKIINQKRIEKLIKKKTASGAISELDKERIAKEIRKIGWTYLGNNVYVHTKCR